MNIENIGSGEGSDLDQGRNGKMARLPADIRHQLNVRLLNGEPARLVLPWLNGLPEVRAVLAAQFKGEPMTPNNLSRWRKGGFQSWRLTRMAQAAAASLGAHDSRSGANGKEASKAGLVEQISLVLTAKIAVVLQQFEGETAERLDDAQRSKVWREVLRNFVLLRRSHLQRGRMQLEGEKMAFRSEKASVDLRLITPNNGKYR